MPSYGAPFANVGQLFFIVVGREYDRRVVSFAFVGSVFIFCATSQAPRCICASWAGGEVCCFRISGGVSIRLISIAPLLSVILAAAQGALTILHAFCCYWTLISPMLCVSTKYKITRLAGCWGRAAGTTLGRIAAGGFGALSRAVARRVASAIISDIAQGWKQFRDVDEGLAKRQNCPRAKQTCQTVTAVPTADHKLVQEPNDKSCLARALRIRWHPKHLVRPVSNQNSTKQCKALKLS